MPLFSDDLVSLNIGSLGVRRDSSFTGIVHASDGSAVWVNWNTHTRTPFAVLESGGRRTTLRLTFGYSHYGVRAYFLGSDGVRALKVYFLPDHGWVTRSEGRLQPRSRFLSPKRRMRQTRERWAAKLLEHHRRHPTTSGREAALSARLESLNWKLARS